MVRILYSYLGWHTIDLLDFLTNQDLEMIDGMLNERDTWASCARKTINVMGIAVGSMFARKNYHKESKNLVESMIVAIKEELKISLNKVDWLDDETRLAATKKADAMIHSIGINCLNSVWRRNQLFISFLGYPEFVFNPDEVEDYYTGFNMESSEYFQNNIRFRQLQLRHKFAKIIRPFDLQTP